jgi:sulfopyruvate decarboxylase subunit beta
MNLTAMVRSMGLSDAIMCSDSTEFESALKARNRFVHYPIKAGNDKKGGDIPLKAMEIKQRFMQALGV